MSTIKQWWWWLVTWFQRRFGTAPIPVIHVLAPPLVEPQAEPLPTPEPVVTEMPQPPPEPVFPHKPAKWAKPKGTKPKREPKPKTEPKPKSESKPKAPRPQVKGEDPEQYGQYYFRDAILDQLDVYFTYLKRMKTHDRSADDMHSRLGIHIMPQSAVQSFDNWRHAQEEDQLSAWWKTNRPAFGAVSYGIDRESIEDENTITGDLSPEEAKLAKFRTVKDDKLRPTNRLATVSSGPERQLPDGKRFKTGLIWIPKFLYFSKWDKVPADVQKVTGGDVYTMTIYWDRTTGHSKTYHKKHKGGTPQDYAIWVERDTGQVRVLRMLTTQSITIASKKEVGGSFRIPHRQWGVPTEFISGASGRTDMCPEDFLCRMFMEAALMYESASLGSMIRITASKGKLTATFGVDIKRTSYFFKDRDVVLNAKGTTAPIFHIVRPHVRKSGSTVPMHFRGLREFDWAGHKVRISVPGRDHFHLAEFDVGHMTEAEVKKAEKQQKRLLDGAQVADRLNKQMKDGLGAWRSR